MESYNKNNLSNARKNRKQRNATKQEGILWHRFLKTYPINFSRQYRVGNYILDFYAPSIKLSIELDGGQHFEDKGIEYDNIRTNYLKSLGITELRFSNLEIDRNLKNVMIYVDYYIREILKVEVPDN